MINKRQLLAVLLDGAPFVCIGCKPSVPGCILPAPLLTEAIVVLNLGREHAGCRHLELTDAGLSVQLAFGGGRPFDVQIPWPALFVVTAHTGDPTPENCIASASWPEDLPVEPETPPAPRRGLRSVS